MKVIAVKLYKDSGDITEIGTIDNPEEIVKLFSSDMLCSQMDNIFYNDTQYYSEEVFLSLDDDRNVVINIYVSEVEILSE